VAEFQLKPRWFETYPEVKDYLRFISRSLETNSNELPVFGPWCYSEEENPEPHRVRGGLDYCAAANNSFQALLADATKLALRRVTREAYTDRDSVLFKAQLRTIGFFHDELFTEMSLAYSSEAGDRVAKIMHDSLKVYTPDIFVNVDTALQYSWSKEAESVRDVNGKLIPWDLLTVMRNKRAKVK
jgi:DNA polymerase I-like protein with 3'-5' exonuclease and polymerase domains